MGYLTLQKTFVNPNQCFIYILTSSRRGRFLFGHYIFFSISLYHSLRIVSDLLTFCLLSFSNGFPLLGFTLCTFFWFDYPFPFLDLDCKKVCQLTRIQVSLCNWQGATSKMDISTLQFYPKITNKLPSLRSWVSDRCGTKSDNNNMPVWYVHEIKLLIRKIQFQAKFCILKGLCGEIPWK